MAFDRAAYYVAYYATHREQIAARHRAYYATHREERAAWSRAYNATHREEKAARSAAYDAAHREEKAARSAAYYAAHPERMRAKHLKHKYGITLAEHADLLERQGGLCASGCSRAATQVDHDHRTKGIRGLLCSGCNKALGLIRDNPATLRALADYLEVANA